MPVYPITGEMGPVAGPLGAGKLSISNETALDACVRVVTKLARGERVRSIYIRGAESYSIADLPAGEFLIYIDLGRDWLAERGVFLKDQQTAAPIGPLDYVQIHSSKGVQSDEYSITLRGASGSLEESPRTN